MDFDIKDWVNKWLTDNEQDPSDPIDFDTIVSIVSAGMNIAYQAGYNKAKEEQETQVDKFIDLRTTRY